MNFCGIIAVFSITICVHICYCQPITTPCSTNITYFCNMPHQQEPPQQQQQQRHDETTISSQIPPPSLSSLVAVTAAPIPLTLLNILQNRVSSTAAVVSAAATATTTLESESRTLTSTTTTTITASKNNTNNNIKNKNRNNNGLSSNNNNNLSNTTSTTATAITATSMIAKSKNATNTTSPVAIASSTAISTAADADVDAVTDTTLIMTKFKNKFNYPNETSWLIPILHTYYHEHPQDDNLPVYIPNIRNVIKGSLLNSRNDLSHTTIDKLEGIDERVNLEMSRPWWNIIFEPSAYNNYHRFRLDSDLMYYMRLSLDASMGKILLNDKLYRTGTYEIYQKAKERHYEYLSTIKYNRRNVTLQIQRHNIALQNHISIIKNRNNIIIYHVECPMRLFANINVIIQGEKIDLMQSSYRLCKYFRLTVRTALETFNYKKNFTFLEIPTEWLRYDQPFINIENMSVKIDNILNFAFTPVHHLKDYYSSYLRTNCEPFNLTNLAHRTGFSIHLNKKINYCLSDYYTGDIEDCDADLLETLLHELSHFFIGSCHHRFGMDLLAPFAGSNVRDLNNYTKTAFEMAWQYNSVEYACLLSSAVP